MSADLMAEFTELVARKNIVHDELSKHAKRQLQLIREAAKFVNLPEHIKLTRFRFVDLHCTVSLDESLNVDCLERGFYGGDDEVCGTFRLSKLIVDGQDQEFLKSQIEYFQDLLDEEKRYDFERKKKDLSTRREELRRQQEQLDREIQELKIGH